MIKLLDLTVKQNHLVMPESRIPHKDQRFIEGLKNNDPVVIREIKEVYIPKVVSYVLKNSGNKEDAKDLFQNALSALWKTVQTRDVILRVPFGGYFYRVYRNLWLNELRNRGKFKIEELKEYEEFVDEANVDDNNERFLKILRHCLKQLSEKYQEMFRLKYAENKKAAEIAEILNMRSENAVFQAMFTYKRNIRTCIKSHPDFNITVL